MGSTGEFGPQGRRQQNPGLVSTFFRKRPAGQEQAQAVFTADAETPRAAGTPHYPPAPPPPAGATARGRWQKLAGRKAQAGDPGAAYSLNQAPTALLQELEYFRGECARQGQELSALSAELASREAEGAALQQQLNMERFKYELLVDLWAMRVLDNEELGEHAGQPGHGEHDFPGG